MKLVFALIRAEQLPAVKQALFDAQIRHVTATTVMGTAQKSEQQMYRGSRIRSLIPLIAFMGVRIS